MDIMNDRRRVNLWIVDADGRDARPLSDRRAAATARRAGRPTAAAWPSSRDDAARAALRALDGHGPGRAAHQPRRGPPRESPGRPTGAGSPSRCTCREKPSPSPRCRPSREGATWAKPPRVIHAAPYRADGEGYLRGWTRAPLRAARRGRHAAPADERDRSTTAARSPGRPTARRSLFSRQPPAPTGSTIRSTARSTRSTSPTARSRR